MDDKFYYPNKIINPITLPHEEFSLKVEQDSITGIFSKKENPKTTLVFYTELAETLPISKKWQHLFLMPLPSNNG